MTEEEAKGKWCPYVRAQKDGDGLDGASNRLTSAFNPSWARCIGSACMAWRWSYSPSPDQQVNAGAVYVQKDGGYCGLSGRP